LPYHFSVSAQNSQVADSLLKRGIDQVRFDVNIARGCVNRLEQDFKLTPTQQAWTNYLKLKIYKELTKDSIANSVEKSLVDTIPYDSLNAYQKGYNLIAQGQNSEGMLLLLDFMEKYGKTIPDSIADDINLRIVETYRINREFTKAIELIRLIIQKPTTLPLYQAYANNRMAALYDAIPGLTFQQRVDSIKKYSETTISIASTYGFTRIMATSQNELASLYRLNNYNLNLAQEFGLKALNNFIASEDMRNAVNSSIVLSDIYLRQGKSRMALTPCYQALTLLEIERNEDMFLRVYLQLAKVHALLGEHEVAYEFLSVGRLIEILVVQSQMDSRIAEMSARYSLELKETEIAHGKQVIKSQNQRTLYLTLFFVLILIAFMFIVLYLWMMKRNITQKHQLDKAENKNLQIMVEKKNLEIKLKNQEVVRFLAGNVEKNNVLKNVKLDVVARKSIEEIVSNINSNIDTEQNWKKVMLDLQQVYPEFLPLLKQRHPDLTQNEIRLSVLLFLDLTSIEIAGILSVSESAISKGRQRLRHKLNLDPKADICGYLKSIS
jgi:DNA-binding CsgD family transcriptional regulator